VSEQLETPKAVDQLSFEEALEELRRLVSGLESGEGKLDQAIEAYERGAQLKAHCETKLAEAKAKIEKIQFGPDGVTGSEPFDES
jgi:exodeoxyribonuclease VII small subunit|tara:strand:- start:5745 stop:5999 length:255 start_codon:yes stop_codon:yes gene_type:complete